ncbi:MAG: MATE family efflux transporter [Dermatophilaceae bacterium]
MAGSLFGTTAVTSGLGFIYWWGAARLADPSMVGYATASINAMQLAGTIGMLGLGSMLIGVLESGRRANPGLVTASVCVAGAASLAIAFGILGFFAMTGERVFAEPRLSQALWFGAGAVLTGALVVLDQALVGSGAGGLQLLRNTVFASSKLVLLFLFLSMTFAPADEGILAAWVAGIVVSLAAIMIAVRRRGVAGRHPDFGALRRLWRAAMAHNAFNIASQFSRLTVPIVASTLVSPEAGAAFFMAWMIAGLAYIVPSHLSTALFAVGAGRLEELRAKLRVGLATATGLGLIGVPALWLVSDPMLRLFGVYYTEVATTPLRILAVCYFAMIVKYHYIAVTRVEGRLAVGSAMASVGALLEVGGAVIGALSHGILGLTIGFGIGLVLECIVMAPTVWSAATRHSEPVAVGS